MTEYDYSPEADMAFRRKMAETQSWAAMHKPGSFAYYTPSQVPSDTSRDDRSFEDDASESSSSSVPPRLVLDYGNGNLKRIPHPLDNVPYGHPHQHPTSQHAYGQHQMGRPAVPGNLPPGYQYPSGLQHPPPPQVSSFNNNASSRRHRSHVLHEPTPPPEPEKIRILPSKEAIHYTRQNGSQPRPHIRSRSLPRDVVVPMENSMGATATNDIPAVPVPPPRPTYNTSYTQPVAFPSNNTKVSSSLEPQQQPRTPIYNHPVAVGPNGMVFSHSAPPFQNNFNQPVPAFPNSYSGYPVPAAKPNHANNSHHRHPPPPPPIPPHDDGGRNGRERGQSHRSKSHSRSRVSSYAGSMKTDGESDATMVYQGGAPGGEYRHHHAKTHSLHRTNTSASIASTMVNPTPPLKKSIFQKIKGIADKFQPPHSHSHSHSPSHSYSQPQAQPHSLHHSHSRSSSRSRPGGGGGGSGGGLRRAATPVILPTPGLNSVNGPYQGHLPYYGGRVEDARRDRRHSTGQRY